jgi:hypothetical protein
LHITAGAKMENPNSIEMGAYPFLSEAILDEIEVCIHVFVWYYN